MKNPLQLIKVLSLVLLLIGVFVLKNFLAEPHLTSFFDSLSFQPKLKPNETGKASSSQTSSSEDKK
jgi:hypothetical protein